MLTNSTVGFRRWGPGKGAGAEEGWGGGITAFASSTDENPDSCLERRAPTCRTCQKVRGAVQLSSKHRLAKPTGIAFAGM